MTRLNHSAATTHDATRRDALAPHLLHQVTSSLPAADLRKRGDQAQLAGLRPWRSSATHSGQDKSLIRTGNGPQVWSAITNLVITLFRIHGVTSFTAETRRCAQDPRRALRLPTARSPTRLNSARDFDESRP